MNDKTHPIGNRSLFSTSNRREFLVHTGKVAAASVLAGLTLPHVHAAENNTLHIALIGCGGRGSGAVGNAFESTGGPVKLVAMADVVEEKLNASFAALSAYKEKVDVPPDRRFVGFDGYRKAMDCLRPGDIAVLGTHAAFRATHLEYAVQKGLHVFMEKSFAPDPAGIQRVLQAGKAAQEKNLKIGTGLMCRHSQVRQAMIQKIRDGALGEVNFIRAYRMDGGDFAPAWKGGPGELLWQIRHPYFFFWVSTGRFIDYLIHQVDECCWIKDSWPVSAHGLGGRTPGSNDHSQNFHSYSIEYTFADGAKAQVNARFTPKCHDDFATFVHGSTCAAQFSGNNHQPTAALYRNQQIAPGNLAWQPEKELINPYVAEWNELLKAIRQDRPYNEVKRSAYSNLAAIMGRAAVHSGKIITWDEALNSKFTFCPSVEFSLDSAAPLQADASGSYPVPVPGTWTEV